MVLAAVVAGGILFRKGCDGPAERSDGEFFETAWTENIKIAERGNRFVGESGVYTAEFTIDPEMQKLAERLLREYNPVMGVFIAMEPETGAVLAIATHERKWKSCRGGVCPPTFLRQNARASMYPMASLVKIVTAAAALESGMIQPGTTRMCNGSERFKGGGVHDPSGIRHGSTTTARALGASCNSIYSRLGVEVGRDRLAEYLDKFLLGRAIEFDLPVLESTYAIGASEISLARAGAGFGDIYISPVHAAAIAGALANGGVMMRPYIIDKVEKSGAAVFEADPREIARPVKEKTAGQLIDMMRATNEPGGTSYKGFYKGGKALAKSFDVVGKTGSLNGRTDKEMFTWMIGSVERGEPRFAFATMILNDGNWRIKAASFSGQFFMHYDARK